jgi:uncharacterized protein (DUF39 family)
VTSKTIDEINEKISDGSAVVVTAEEMKEIVEEVGAEEAVKQVDVVTTGTFGAMCSSGVFFNFGHADPPIKMQKVWMNDVEAYTGVAAVDAYLGVTQISEKLGIEYGGAHVIEELVRGKEIELRATAYGTDCYPRKELVTEITLDDVNQAEMVNPRNAYQRYKAATNSSNKILKTYMGTLLPNFGNVTFAGTGEISPLNNDPEYRTIGLGTRIFLCGAEGYVIGEGTQHAPPFGTLMVKGDLKEMDPEYMRACVFPGYGVSMFIGIGIPIPILDAEMAKFTAIRDRDIETEILDYGVPRRGRPVVRKVNYEELKSGKVEINGEEVRVSPLSSYSVARKIMEELKRRIEKGEFYLSEPIKRIPVKSEFKPMRQKEIVVVRNLMSPAIKIYEGTEIVSASKLIIEKGVNHLPVVDREGKLRGIVTSWDIAKAVAKGRLERVDEIMTKDVVTVGAEDPIEFAAEKLKRYNISALPVIDAKKRVLGMLTSEDISSLIARRG